jgi:hypothetical protein
MVTRPWEIGRSVAFARLAASSNWATTRNDPDFGRLARHSPTIGRRVTGPAGLVAKQQSQPTRKGECDQFSIRALTRRGPWYPVAVQDEVGLVEILA